MNTWFSLIGDHRLRNCCLDTQLEKDLEQLQAKVPKATQNPCFRCYLILMKIRRETFPAGLSPILRIKQRQSRDGAFSVNAGEAQHMIRRSVL